MGVLQEQCDSWGGSNLMKELLESFWLGVSHLLFISTYFLDYHMALPLHELHRYQSHTFRWPELCATVSGIPLYLIQSQVF